MPAIRRSGDSYGAKVGVELDMGESFAARLGSATRRPPSMMTGLADIDTAVVDAHLLWSPLTRNRR